MTPEQSALLHAIADNRQMQVEGITSLWRNANSMDALRAILEGEPCRIKPDTVTINGVECEAPQQDKFSFSVCITLVGNNELLAEDVFYWPKKDAARTVFEALIKPFNETNN